MGWDLAVKITTMNNQRFYILRQQVQEFLAKFTQSLNQPCSNPVLFNIWGRRGVGKTTLLEQMEVDYEQLASDGVTTPSKPLAEVG